MEESLLRVVNNSLGVPWLDLPMAVLSSWDFWWPLLILLASGMLWKGGFRARSMIVTGLFCIGVVDGLITNSLKPLVGRPRPHQVLEDMRRVDLAKAKPRVLAIAKPPVVEMSKPKPGPQRGKSCPSGHAANNFAIATLVFLFYRRYGWLAFVPAALVGYSRLYVGSHWPSDVLGGMLIGIAGTTAVVWATDRVWQKLGPRLLPRIAAANPRIPPRT